MSRERRAAVSSAGGRKRRGLTNLALLATTGVFAYLRFGEGTAYNLCLFNAKRLADKF